MTDQQQQAMDSFYALDNVITIKITMPQTEWDKVRLEEPKSGRCEWDWTGGARYTWRKADTVEISGTRFPAATTFADVGVKKKSFCGSIDDKKPCVHIDLGRFSSTTEDAAEALIGTRYVTLNNSKQDDSYIRQTLGYRMLDMAGLPHSRCNYARVFVNGTPIGEGLGGELFPGVFVNAEPIMKRYIERHFNGNMNGNLYEIEHTDDFTEDRLPFIGVEDLSEFDDKADLKFAVQAYQGQRPCRRRPDARYGAVPQGLRDGVSPQALGRLRQQHQQHLSLQRRHGSRVARRRQHQIQDDPVGYRPDTQTPRVLSGSAVMGGSHSWSATTSRAASC